MVPGPAGATPVAVRTAAGAAADATVGSVATPLACEATFFPAMVISGRPVSASMNAAMSAKRSAAFLASARSTAATTLGLAVGTIWASEGWGVSAMIEPTAMGEVMGLA